MERSKGVTLAGAILFLMAVQSLILSGLKYRWLSGEGIDLAMLSTMTEVLNAGIIILAGKGVYSLAGWSRPLGLVIGFWTIIWMVLALFAAAVSATAGSPEVWMWRLSIISLLTALFLVGTLFWPSVRAELSPRVPRPRSLTTLGALYFIHAMLILFIGASLLSFTNTALPLWGRVVGLLVVAFFVSVFLLLGIGLLDLRSWARKWVLIFAWITVGSYALGWVILIAQGPSESAVGSYIGQNVMGLPVSIFALWCLTRSQLKEMFLRTV